MVICGSEGRQAAGESHLVSVGDLGEEQPSGHPLFFLLPAGTLPGSPNTPTTGPGPPTSPRSPWAAPASTVAWRAPRTACGTCRPSPSRCAGASATTGRSPKVRAGRGAGLRAKGALVWPPVRTSRSLGFGAALTAEVTLACAANDSRKDSPLLLSRMLLACTWLTSGFCVHTWLQAGRGHWGRLWPAPVPSTGGPQRPAVRCEQSTGRCQGAELRWA